MRDQRNNLLYIAVATLTLTFILIGLSHTEPLTKAISTSLGLIAALICLLLGNFIWLMLHVYFWFTENGERTRHAQLDEAYNPIPEYMVDMAQEIENLGFTKLGVKAMENNQSTTCIWLWVDDTQMVVAFLTEFLMQQPIAYFYSHFADGFTLETSWNYGWKVNGSALMTNRVEHSINEAYHLHVRLQDEQELKHGKCTTFDTVASTFPDPKQHKLAMKDLFASKIQEIAIRMVMWGIVLLGLVLYKQWLPIDTPLEVAVIVIMSVCAVMVTKSQFGHYRTGRKSARKSA